MKTTVERDTQTKLRLLIEAEPSELAPLYEETVKRLAREVNIPGFRKGKVPRTVLESRVGKETLREEVLRDALPALYAKAAEAESLRPVALPDIEVNSYEEGQPLTFTATVEVRPEIRLPEYRGIEVQRPVGQPTDEEVSEQLDRLRERFGTLEPVARNATKADYVTIDLQGYRHEVQIEEVSAHDLVYEVGSGAFVPQLDEELEDKRAGDILKFNAVLPEGTGTYAGEEVSFSVIVKEVQAKRLPSLDDDFAKTASEFDTLEELREEIRQRLAVLKAAESDAEVRSRVLEDLIDRCDLPLPEAMVEAETGARLTRLVRDLERAGLTLEKYLEGTNTSRDELVSIYRTAAEKAVSADLVLEALAETEGIEVSHEDLETEIESLARRSEVEESKVREELESSGRVELLAGDILRRKALDFLVEQAKVTDEAV